MATYVTSDIHGHVRALDRALESCALTSADSVVVLGDMIDRGPAPLEVVRLVRDLPRATVLMGNHEAMLLNARIFESPRTQMEWEMNGGFPTSEALCALPMEDQNDIIDWMSELPLSAVALVEDQRASVISALAGGAYMRPHIFAHAGIDSARLVSFLRENCLAPDVPVSAASVDELMCAMADQPDDDLLWIRDGFWGAHTGLIDETGMGALVVSGHTTSLSLKAFAGSHMGGTGLDENERGCVVEVGASFETAGEADRLCVDAAAANGHPFGRVAVVRLEDRRVFYSDVLEGE